MNGLSQLLIAYSLDDITQPLCDSRFIFNFQHTFEFGKAYERQQWGEGFHDAPDPSNARCIPNEIKCRCLGRANPSRRKGILQLLCRSPLNLTLDEKPNS